MMRPFLTLTRGRMPTVATLLLAAVVAACLADLSAPTMAAANVQDCSGPTCDQQLVCSQPVQPQISSGHPLQFIAAPATIEADLAPEKSRGRLAPGSPPARHTWPSVAPLAPRSPPAV